MLPADGPHPMKRTWFALALVFGLATRPAWADDTARAEQSFREARSAYDRGDFTAAAAGFEQAAVYRAHPALLLNASAAWEMAGDLPRAASACDRALAFPDASEDIRARARTMLEQLEPRIATLSIAGPSDFRVRLDAAAPAPVPARLRLHPGAHDLEELRPDGTTVKRPLQLAAGASMEIVLGATAPAETPEAIARPASPRGGRRVPATSIVAWGVGAAALGTMAVFGVRAVSAKDRFDASPSYDARDDFYANRTAANVALGIGLAAIAAGVVLYFIAPTHGSAGARARPASMGSATFAF